jgi:hypothetical protein
MRNASSKACGVLRVMTMDIVSVAQSGRETRKTVGCVHAQYQIYETFTLLQCSRIHITLSMQ